MRDTLLIIDDSELDLAILNEIFKNTFHVKCLSNAKMGVSFLEQHKERICAILLDICLGRKGAGFSVLQEIHNNAMTSDIPIILITTDASKEYVMEGMSYGATDFLVKPVDPHTVQERVSNTIRQTWSDCPTILDCDTSTTETNQTTLIPLLPKTLSTQEVESIACQWAKKLSIFCSVRPGLLLKKYHRIQQLTRILAQNFVSFYPTAGLTLSDAVMIGEASLFYDVGLIAIPDTIVQADLEKLSPNNRSLYELHTQIGRDLFLEGSAENKFLTYCAEIAYLHHKHYDGSGYPNISEHPPLSAQLVCTALHCDLYIHRYLQYTDVCDRMLTALSSDSGHAISNKMFQTAKQSRDEIAVLVPSLYAEELEAISS